MRAHQATAVAIGAKAVIIEGPPGSGKSSLALALIDRGAQLIGDDSLMLEERDRELVVHPHPNTRGLMEVRNLGLLNMSVCEEATAQLVIALTPKAPRYVEEAGSVQLAGIVLPLIELDPEGDNLAIKAELALERYGKPSR